MIEYPYIPPVSGEAANRVLEMIETNSKRSNATKKSSSKRESSFRMFRNAGILV